ncbi:hypothetical protein F5Y03DRAFT_93051 [Xylaria venustula]|nr:hypothetical protein F5Y03DRAFT_93051 [Xylaria venustula]
MTTDVQRQDTSRGGQPAAPKRKRADTSNSTESISANNKRQRFTSRLCPSSADDAKVLSTVDARYEVQLQSVISSSKIRQRVTAILRHLTASANPSSADQTSNVATSKTKISVLRSKASEAGKLISIAEIAKREIETENEKAGSDGETGQGGGRGRWFQYIALGEELQHRDRDEVNTVIEETVLGGPDTDERDHEEDDEFEVMKTPFERAIEGQPLARGVPVMSLFLSRSPVEELKRRYGEQTNAPPK